MYEDWAVWAGDHPEQAEAELRRDRERAAALEAARFAAEHGVPMPAPEPAECEHTDFYPNGYCCDCGEPVPAFEPTDDMIETDQLRKWTA